jgi:hypothetical protein
MPETTEYRIEYSIQRCDDESGDFVEIGFGSSGTWVDVDGASHAIGTDIEHRQWETRPGMPDPEEVDRG